MIRKLLGSILILLVLVVAAGAPYVASRQNLRYDTLAPAITASADTTVIARGHYIVWSVAPCAGCHGDPAQTQAFMDGAEIPLSGGYHFDIPPGTFYVRNITSDPATGIGAIPDSLIARALRYGVRHDGRPLLPFMELQGMSDEDLTAVISYLRTVPPVTNRVPDHRPNLLGRVVLATILSKPIGPKAPPPAVSPHGATVENGRYLAGSVALCVTCHTQRNPNTGEYTGTPFAGAKAFESDTLGNVYNPPNLTPAARTGRLTNMTEDEFVARIRAGRAVPHSPMPWQVFSRMHEEDLRAIYRFLHSLPPTENDVGPGVTQGKART